MPLCRLIVLVGFLVSIGSAQETAAANSAFVHTATADTMGFSRTYLRHSELNGEPNAIVLATQNWNPGGTGGVYNDHTNGAFYSWNSWLLFDQDWVEMLTGVSLDLLGEAAPEAVERCSAVR